jgi:hypothetical protein
MAVAVEALPAAAEAAEGGAAAARGAGAAASGQRAEGAAWQTVSNASGRIQSAPRAAAGAAWNANGASVQRTLTRLIWAVAVGLVALQIVAELTGQYWGLNLPATGRSPAPEPYLPLYHGQQDPLVFTGTTTSAALAPVPLSNRSAGNQAVQ